MKHIQFPNPRNLRKKIKDSELILENLFQQSQIATFRKSIQAILHAANSGNVYKDTMPEQALSEFKQLKTLVNIAWNLHLNKLEQIRLNSGRQVQVPESWDSFTRQLSFYEYLNPAIILEEFFRYQSRKEWKDQLNCIFEYAKGKMSLAEAGLDLDLLSIYFNLIRLLEAIYIIHRKNLISQPAQL